MTSVQSQSCMQSTQYINLSDVSLSFNKNGVVDVLNNISFSVSYGERLAVVGVSGSGKSTLLRLLAGLLRETSGEITIQESNPTKYITKGELGFMFQDPTLLEHLTVHENILLPLHIHRRETTDTEQIIAMVGLTQHTHKYPSELSVGMKSRVALARCFVAQPKLLLLDEPFAALDVAWKHTLYRELQILCRKYGTSYVLVTHDISEAIELSDAVVCISTQGEMLMSKTSTQEAYLLEKLKQIILNDHISQYTYANI